MTELSEQNPMFGPIVEKVNALMEANVDKWKKRYLEMGPKILKNLESYDKIGKKLQNDIKVAVKKQIDGLHLYTTMGEAKGEEYFLRFFGQRMCRAYISEEGIPQLKPLRESERPKGDKEYRDLYPKFNEPVNISSREAKEFFTKLEEYSSETKSPELKLESQVLMALEKKSGKKENEFRNMQPVMIGKGFLQLYTKIKASSIKNNEHKIEYSDRGGGIDILARVKDENNQSILAVIELKDQNKKGENVELVMKQAMAYATFIAHLLAEEEEKLGEKWYNIFRGIERIEKSKKMVGVPESIKILVVAMMPHKENGENEEDINEEKIEWQLGNKTIELQPCTCYLENGIISSRSTIPQHKLNT